MPTAAVVLQDFAGFVKICSLHVLGYVHFVLSIVLN